MSNEKLTKEIVEDGYIISSQKILLNLFSDLIGRCVRSLHVEDIEQAFEDAMKEWEPDYKLPKRR